MVKLLLVLLLLFAHNICKAQLTDELNRHFIVAIDVVPAPCYRPVLQDTASRTAIERVLKYFEISEHDRLSIVTFGISLSNPDFDNFAYIPRRTYGELLWKNMNDADLSRFGNWKDIAYNQHHNVLTHHNPLSYNLASFQSGAKPYIMGKVQATCYANGNMVGANETILLIVSDQVVNSVGNRWEDEWADMAAVDGANINKYFPQVKAFIKSANETLYFNEIKIGNRDYYQIASGFYKNGTSVPYTIKAYKLKIAPKPLQAISLIPTPLPVKRVRRGYELSLDVLSFESIDSCYTIEKMELEIVRTGKKIEIYRKGGDSLSAGFSGEKPIKIGKADFRDGDDVKIRAWVRYKDGIYNGTVMNPYDPQYMGAMTIPQTVRLKEDAKILGVLPLSDFLWWWFPDDIFTAVMIWDLIILLLFILVVGLILYRCFVVINHYKPSDDKLKITKI